MAEFDPYLKWLGIRDPQRPPNHYRLLGIEIFENDREIIASAADRQMAHIRSFQNGPDAAVSQKLLNQLATARACLLNEQKKFGYDQGLKAGIQAAQAPTPAPQPATASPTPEPEAPAPIDLNVQRTSLPTITSKRAGRKKKTWPQIAGLIGGLAFAAILVVVLINLSKGNQTTPEKTEVAQTNSKPGKKFNGQKNKKKPTKNKAKKSQPQGKKSTHSNKAPKKNNSSDKKNKKSGTKKSTPNKNGKLPTQPETPNDSEKQGDHSKKNSNDKVAGGNNKNPENKSNELPNKIETWGVDVYSDELPKEYDDRSTAIARQLDPVYYAIATRKYEQAKTILARLNRKEKSVQQCSKILIAVRDIKLRYDAKKSKLTMNSKLRFRDKSVRMKQLNFEASEVTLESLEKDSTATTVLSFDFESAERDWIVAIIGSEKPSESLEIFKRFDYGRRPDLLSSTWNRERLRELIANGNSLGIQFEYFPPAIGKQKSVPPKRSVDATISKLKRQHAATLGNRLFNLRVARSLIDQVRGNSEEYLLTYAKLQFAAELCCESDANASDVNRIADLISGLYKVSKTEFLLQISRPFLTQKNHQELDRVSLGFSKILIEQFNIISEQRRFPEALKLLEQTHNIATRLNDANAVAEIAKWRKHTNSKLKLMKAAKAAVKELENRTEPALSKKTAIGEYLCFVVGDYPNGLKYLADGENKILKKLAQQDMALVNNDYDAILAAVSAWRHAGKGKSHVQLMMKSRARFILERTLPTIKDEKLLKKYDREMAFLPLVSESLDPNTISLLGKFRELKDTQWLITWKNGTATRISIRETSVQTDNPGGGAGFSGRIKVVGRRIDFESYDGVISIIPNKNQLSAKIVSRTGQSMAGIGERQQ